MVFWWPFAKVQPSQSIFSFISTYGNHVDERNACREKKLQVEGSMSAWPHLPLCQVVRSRGSLKTLWMKPNLTVIAGNSSVPSDCIQVHKNNVSFQASLAVRKTKFVKTHCKNVYFCVSFGLQPWRPSVITLIISASFEHYVFINTAKKKKGYSA